MHPDPSILVNAMRATFSMKVAPATVSGAVSEVRAWVRGERDRGAVRDRLLDLRDHVSEAFEAGEADLARCGYLDPGMRAMIERVQSEMARLLEAGVRLVDEVDLGRAERVETLTEAMAEAAEAVRDARETLDAWRADEQPTCPRCGYRGDAAQCCGMALLVADSASGDEGVVTLGPTYVRLYEACEAVARGQAGDDSLVSAALEVEREVGDAFWRIETVARTAEQPDTDLSHLQERLSEISAGSGQIRGFVQTRRVRDLNEGWARIARAAAALQSQVAALVTD